MAGYWGYEAEDLDDINNESLWPNWDPTRISKTSAMKQYRLNESDLRTLTDVTTRPNPYSGFRANTVTLFLIEDVEALAESKAQEKAAALKYKQEHADEIAAEKADKARLAKEQAVDEANQLLQSCTAVGCAVSGGGGGFKLPVEVLGSILEKLVDSTATSSDQLKPCAGQLARLSLVCTDFYQAVHSHGLPKLAESAWALQTQQPLPQRSTRMTPPGQRRSPSQLLCRLQQLRDQLGHLRSLPGPARKNLTWKFWDHLVCDPQGFYGESKQTELKEALKLIGQKVTGTKTELVVRLIEALGLKQPAAAPAQLLVVLQELRLRKQPL